MKEEETPPLLKKRRIYLKRNFTHFEIIHDIHWRKMIARLNYRELWQLCEIADALMLRKFNDKFILKMLELNHNQLRDLHTILQSVMNSCDPSVEKRSNDDNPFREKWDPSTYYAEEKPSKESVEQPRTRGNTRKNILDILSVWKPGREFKLNELFNNLGGEVSKSSLSIMLKKIVNSTKEVEIISKGRYRYNG